MFDYAKHLETHLTAVKQLIENLTVDDIEYIEFIDTIVLKNNPNLPPVAYSFTFKTLTIADSTLHDTIHVSYDLKQSLIRHKFNALRWEFLEQQNVINEDKIINSILNLCHTGK